jgi:hypothetical protein
MTTPPLNWTAMMDVWWLAVELASVIAESAHSEVDLAMLQALDVDCVNVGHAEEWGKGDRCKG